MHLMIDLETLATTPEATVLTIGACKFDPKGDDYLIDRVVKEIETGKLSYINRPPKTKAGKKAKKRNRKPSQERKTSTAPWLELL